MRPALEGIVSYESLIDGTVGLADLALMNEALDVRAENNERIKRHLDGKK